MPWRHLRRHVGDPLGVTQPNPYETFLFLVMLANSIPLLGWDSGEDSGSAALQSHLPVIAVQLWGLFLLLGSGSVLIALYLTSVWWSNVLERFGQLLIFAAAAVYATTILVAYQGELEQIRYILLLHFGISAAAALRAVQITRRLNWLKHQAIRELPRYADKP